MDGVIDEYQGTVVEGVMEAAREYGVNLVLIEGCIARAPHRFSERRGVIYDVARSEAIDGLVIQAGTLGNFLSQDDLARYCERFRPRPMVSIAAPLKGAIGILVDGEEALRRGIHHLIEDHQYRRIAFVGGPEGNLEAGDRLRTYREMIGANRLPQSDSFVVTGDYQYESGVDAVHALFDERGATFDAIVVANDQMALGVIDALRARGIRVPRDVAILGFDDIAEATYCAPPLTTIRQPLRQQGRLAVEVLLRCLRGEDVDDAIALPAELVVRRSCGCPVEAYRVSVMASLPPQPTQLGPVVSVGDALSLRRSLILKAMRGAVSRLPDRFPEGWEEGLLDALIAELQGTSHGFVERVETLLEDVTEAGGSSSACHQALGALRRELMPCLAADPQMLSRAEALLQAARVMVGEAAEEAQSHRRLILERQATALTLATDALGEASDLASLGEALRECLPPLGVPSAYLVLDKDASSAGGRVAFAHDPLRDPAVLAELRNATVEGISIPNGLLPADRTYAMLVEPLFFKDDPLGYAVFEMGPPDQLVYEALRVRTSSALKVALLFEELQVRAGQLRQAQKMETLGQLAGGIAHDFNNLLQAIHGYAELAKNARAGTAELRADIEEIVRAADRAAGLTRQLLTFSQPTPPNASIVDVNACISQAIPMIRHLLGPTIQLSTVLRAEAGSILIDPTQLEQAIVNLCVNSRDAMPEGGSLTIETGRRAAARGISARPANSGRGLLAQEPTAPQDLTVVTVGDTGVGIPAEIRERIFEPFFTTKEIGQGTGLGLSIVYGIVRTASGEVAVESEPGRGTRFSLTFPASAVPEEAHEIAVEPRAHGTETVLLVEDEQAIRKLAERVLTDRGYRVLVAANAAEARQLWSANEGAVDLLLSDVTMPGLSGVAFAAELARSARPPRTLFISGYLAGGADGPDLPPEAGFLPKPFSVAALLEAVRTTLDQPAAVAKADPAA